jgi:MFS family permease
MMTEKLPQHAVTETADHNGRRISPWLFVPLLYFMQAIPVTVVQDLATIFYKDMGIANEPITRWTSLISLPWSLQILLGPLVDLNSTKRRWTLAGQAICAIGIIATAFIIRVPHAFELTLVILGATAIVSALCNIATDGFYILSMSKAQQAKFVGVQSTCYRLGALFCVGILVQVAGKLANGGMNQTAAWSIVLLACGGIYVLGHILCRVTVPSPPQDDSAAAQEPIENRRNVARTLAVVGLGLGGYFALNSVVRLTAHALWAMLDGSTTGSLKGWMLGSRADLLGILLPGMTAETVQLVISASVAVACYWASKKTIARTPMGDAFASFVQQKGIVPIFFFILFYRFGEAMVRKMSPLFLKDAIANGGLAISNDQLGVIKGYFGVSGMVLGGIIGGVLVGRIGLRRAILPLAVCMHLPNLLYLTLATTKLPMGYAYLGSYFGNVPLTLVGIDFVDQFGYGFGFAAYMVYIMYVAQRSHYQTAHMAIGTGAGALCIAIAGIVSGIIQSNFGYAAFFISVIFLSLPGLITLFFIPMDDVAVPAPAT